MKKRLLYPALMVSALGLVPSFGCSSATENTSRTSNGVAEGCTYFAETGHSVCDNDRGKFKSTFDKFGLAAVGYPLTDAYPDGKGDWYQAFERVDMNSNFGQGCEGGRACVAHLGRWDIENVQRWSIGGKVSDCASDAVGERVNELCMPHDFLDKNYYKNGELEFYGHMLTRVYDNCPLYPSGVLGQCFWTERAKVGRIYGETEWLGEHLGRKKLELTGTENPGPPPVDPPIPTDPRMNLPPTTIYLPSSTPGVENYQAKAGAVTVCRQGADAALVAQLEKFAPGREYQSEFPAVIVQTGPKSWETRKATGVNQFNPVFSCPNSDGFTISLFGDSVDWLQDFDLAGSFINEFGSAKITCEQGIQIDQFALDVKRFPIQNGRLQKPALTVTIGGVPFYENKIINCSWEQKTPLLYTQVGIVPVAYELYFSLGLSMQVTKASRWQAKLGTEDGAHFWVESDPEAGTAFVLTPQIRLGVTFYKTVSAYAGLDFPITATQKPNCTTEYKVGGQIVAGAELNIPGVNSMLQAEWTSDPLFERVLREGKCGGAQ